MTQAAQVRRWRSRLLALALGCALTPVVLAGIGIGPLTPAEGQERCGLCKQVRDVKEVGPFRSTSDLRGDFLTPEPAPDCARHDWHRIGCWLQGATSMRYGAD